MAASVLWVHLIHLTKSDTAGEVIFTPARPLTPQVFQGLPHVNRIYFGLRQQ
jgi:hypothetical protein